MDGILYPASVVLLILLAFVFNKSDNSKLALLMIVIGVYIVYSHETGDSATNWKNKIVESIDEDAKDYSQSRDIKGYDADKTKESVK